MKKLIALFLLFAGTAVCQDPGWPRQMTRNGATLIYYQPQVDSWSNFAQLRFRMAVSLTPSGGKAALGVVSVAAQTNNDVDTHNVTISDLTITNTSFPGLDPAQAKNMDELARTFLAPGSSVTISMDRLVALSNRGTQPSATVAVNNTPPQIFVSYSPAILLQVEGQPTKASVPNTKLQFIVNSNFPVFFDPDGSRYYLYTGKQWLTASDLSSTWLATTKIPKDMSKVPSDPAWSDLKSAVPAPKYSGTVPAVFFSNGPAEVLLFQGQPNYANIPGTRLVYAANTESDVFLYSPTRQVYFLAAGRWFTAPSLSGPWTFATNELPPDFSRIPRNSPAARVLVSVPGTEQASDAVLLAQIPTTVVVNPTAAAAKVNVTYYGTPQFVPINGTTMQYATNTADKVIQVGDLYYLCLQGIWFMSTTPQGPWQTATSVPSQIYTIPPSSPVYNVTYVTQTTTSNGNVQASYTAGYLGAFVVGATVGAVIAGGTGYYYPPYVGCCFGAYPYYRPYPSTYGVGSYYNPYTGAYGAARGVYGPYGGVTGAASYNPYTGTYARGATAYGPYGSRSAAAAYNPYTGSYARAGSVSTAYGSAGAAAGYNPYTHTGAATRQASSPYGSWGSSVVSNGNQWAAAQHTSNASGTYGSMQTSAGGRAYGASTANGTAYAGKAANGDMYAGSDGNVYKNSNGSWQKYDNGSWNTVTPPTQQQVQSKAQSYQQQHPNTNYQQEAQQRTQSYQQQHPDTNYQQQAQQRAQSYQQQRPENANNWAQRSSSEGSDHWGGLNQDWQNRQRGDYQTSRFQGFQRSGGGWGGGERGGGWRR